MLHLFSFFHLNLAFSSIEEEERPEVIRCCYWPLLHLIRDQCLPVGIEASGYTLEEIKRLDPDWLVELQNLCREGIAEFIGSGYTQIIGPLVPAAVNRANQRIGLEVYEEILGFRPEIVLVNEQAYAAGLIPIYREAGYRAIIMEWENSGSGDSDWNPDWRYLPQYAKAPDGSVLPVIWNQSIPFQKFQRYTHGEMELPAYLEFLGNRVESDERTFALYGNDAEIFDYRPGRFHTETTIGDDSEWGRIGRLYETIRTDKRFTLILPSQVLDFIERDGAGNHLQLESVAHPVPVKKQAKYNVTRWALTGNDDFHLNTACWQLYNILDGESDSLKKYWKELCYLWSSDFRTHITLKRWLGVQKRLSLIQGQLNPVSSEDKVDVDLYKNNKFSICPDGDILDIETEQQRLRLNCRRGLVIDGWWDKDVSGQPLIKTLPHGYFDNINYGADYYTGHFVLETPGQHKVTDLCEVEPEWKIVDGSLIVHADIATSLGNIRKEIRLTGDNVGFEVLYHFNWAECPSGNLRLGHITLNPELFDKDRLFFRTHNGGEMAESFLLGNKDINHLMPVSGLVSARSGLGLTSGMAAVGDDRRLIRIEVDKSSAAVTGHIVFTAVNDSYLFRFILSAMENDDTSCHIKFRQSFSDCVVKFRVFSDSTGC